MIRRLCIVLVFFFHADIFSREFAFLPAHIIGEAPSELKKKDPNINEGFAELAAYYGRQNYQMEVTEFDRVRNILNSVDTYSDERKPDRNTVSAVCSETEPDYIVKSEIDFEGSAVIYTGIYNCKGKLVYSAEDRFSQDIYSSVERHSKKLFSFLSPKKKDGTVSYSGNSQTVFALDLSSSVSGDVKAAADYIDSISGSAGTEIGLMFLHSKKSRYIPPSGDSQSIRKELKNISFGNSLRMNELADEIQKFYTKLSQISSRDRKFVLFTDARSGGKDSGLLLTVLQKIKSLGFKTYLISGSFFDYKEAKLYKKLGRAVTAHHELTHFQKIGTVAGFRMVYLKDRRIYFENGERETPYGADFREMQSIPEGKVYSFVEFPHPGNFSEVYSKIYSEKVLEKSRVKSDIKENLDSILHHKSSASGKVSRRVLVKSGGQAVWISVSDLDDSFEGKEVSFHTVFRKEFSNPAGFRNVPESTSLYNDSTPLLLVLTPSDIRKLLTKRDSVSGFVKGKVLEIR